ncbi:unnamed protein product [Clonostachys rosea]|uniref:GH16 domain-containing protein n=1 Tax=Bionectria ochroleuca TaxID=29856 RepID=A0ABY6UJM9_BIOOC|nr:unnamed protein product [Clonostachys rosea]
MLFKTHILQGLVAAAAFVSGSNAQPSAPNKAAEQPQKRASFRDDFTTFDSSIWSCEYSCPVIEGEKARFRLYSNTAANQEHSWCKARYKPARFTSGTFTTLYSLTERPKQPVWWGVALYDDTYGSEEGQINEINFGYTTKYSYNNYTFLFEVYKRGNTEPWSRDITVDFDLYNEEYHEATIEYDASHVALYIDGVKKTELTDSSLIPTDAMDFLLGPRLVDDTLGTLPSGFTQSHDWVTIEY